MASWLDELPGRIGTAVSPYGFAPPQPGMVQGNPAAGAGMQFLGDMGMQMLANGRENPAVALGQAYGKARESARDRSKDAMVMQQMMQQAEQERQKREEERQRKAQLEQYISTLPPEQQALARMFPEKFGGEQIEQQFAPQQTPEGFTLGEGQVRYGPDGQQIASGPPKSSSEAPPADVREFQFAVQQGFKGTYMDWKAAQKGNGVVISPDGTVQIGGSGPMNVEQAKNAGFYNRAKKAGELLDGKETALTDSWSATGSRVPGVGNFLKSEDYRQAEQTAREFLAPILRKDTGAAVTPDELTTYGGIYIPQPGDDAGTIQQKREARARAVESLKMGVPAQAIIMMEMERQQGNDATTGGTSGKTSTGVPWSIE